MALKVDKITNYVLMLNEDEIDTIISALYDAGEDDLADEISEELFGEDEECKDCDCDPADDNATASVANLEEKFFGGKSFNEWFVEALRHPK